MTDQKLRALVAQAVRLDRAVTKLEEQLKLIKSQIAAEAESRSEEAVPTEGGGTSITFEGVGGCIARVTATARALKAMLKPEAKDFAKIKEAAKGFFSRLFETEIVHKPVPNFRAVAKELLGEPAAKKLIKLCENSGKVTVSFETKAAAAPEEGQAA